MEVEAAKCECCGFVEECTPEYIAAVREAYLGRWICGLCAEAVGDEIRRSGAGRPITTAEALDRHVAFSRSVPPPGKAAEHLVAAVARLLRRCLDSPSPPQPPPRGGKVAPSCSNGTVT